MRGRRILYLLISIIMLFGSGCAERKEAPQETKKEVKSNTSDEKKDLEKPQKDKETEVMAEEKPKESEPFPLMVYSGNDMADGFITETITIDSLTPQAVLEQLVIKGVLPKEVQLLKCERSQLDGENVVDLDFSKELTDYVNNMGTAGEKIAVGSICNTFMDAYGCTRVSLHVEGQPLETGHNIYSEYMDKYE